MSSSGRATAATGRAGAGCERDTPDDGRANYRGERQTLSSLENLSNVHCFLVDLLCEPADVDAEVDDAGVPVSCLGGLESQGRFVGCRQAVVNPVARVARVSDAARAVWAQRIYGVRQRVVEEELRRELVALRRPRVEAELEVDVNGASTLTRGREVLLLISASAPSLGFLDAEWLGFSLPE